MVMTVMEGLLLRKSEISAALKVLFPDKGDGEVLESLELSGLKSAYRKRALQIHPDRVASCREEYRRGCCESFIEVKHAYEILNSYLKLKAGDFGPGGREREAFCSTNGSGESRSVRPSPAFNSEIDLRGFIERSFYQTGVPRRYLRFGEFLYYSGLIPWQALTRALLWQRKNRPRIGEIAQERCWLTEFQVTGLLRNRHPGDFLGALLLDRGIINSEQLNELLSEQEKFRSPIGKFFLIQKLLDERQMRYCLLRQQMHNLR